MNVVGGHSAIKAVDCKREDRGGQGQVRRLEIDAKAGLLHAGADPRRSAHAIGR